MIVVHELLGYPRIKIYQDTEMLSFSTDSMLLASFVTINRKTKNVMDLCSGNGPIALYLTLRTTADIHALELQKEACDLLEMSLKENKLEDRIKVVNANIKDYKNLYSHRTFDVITCNPPFFTVPEEPHFNDSKAMTIARHEVEMDLNDACQAASYLLKDNGYFAMVHRPDRLADIMICLSNNHLEPKRIRFVYPKQGAEANHVLVEAIKTRKKGGLKVLPPLYIYDDNQVWTKEVLEIYNYNIKE